MTTKFPPRFGSPIQFVPPRRESGATSRRARQARPWRPTGVEALEGRALLSVTPLDPAFNGGRPVVNPTSVVVPATSLNTGSAVAVQPDNKIVVVGTIRQPGTTFTSRQVGVRRFNADGSVDTTFGAAGEANLALPTGAFDTVFVASTVLIQPDGKIVLAARLAQSGMSPFSQTTTYTNVETVAIRLNADGSADSAFGTAGTTVISTAAAALTQVALQADGKVLLAGTATGQIAATRLNTDGSVDPSFNGGNLLTLSPETYGAPFLSSPLLAALLVTPGGQVALGWSISPDNSNAQSTYQIAEFNTDGTPNTAFGVGGIVRGPSTRNQTLTTAAIQADGKFVLVLNTGPFVDQSLTRLNADGSVDPGFANPALPFTPNSIVVQADGKILLDNSGGSTFAVARYTASGAPDGTFGAGGQARFSVPPLVANNSVTHSAVVNSLALTPGGQAVVVGTAMDFTPAIGTFGRANLAASQLVVARLRTSTPTVGSGDYDGDGRSDIAAQLSNFGVFAIRKSTGGDLLQGFGAAGAGKTVPAPGDYDGDGITDVAAYLADFAALAYRPSAGGTDVIVPFGSPGVGASIPAPGDYDGDGRTDVAIYLPAAGSFAIRPSGGGANYLTQFGFAGTGQTIPAPGDYDGDGRTDVAAYLPTLGILAYRPSSGGADSLVSFGSPGVGASIPAPGDYDGDGRTDVAIYLPAAGSFAIRPSGGGANYLVQFGLGGSGGSIPAPGDYDGDGRTDLAVYLPSLALFASRPSGGGGDLIAGFGASGTGQTIPASSIPAAQPPTGATAGVRSAGLAPTSAAIDIPLTDDMLSLIGGTTTRKKSATGRATGSA